MKRFKFSGYIAVGFEKIVECENIEKANELADELDDSIKRVDDVNDCDANKWIEEVVFDELEELKGC